MREARDQPQAFRELLGTLAKRVKKVDLDVMDEVRQRWPHVVEGPLGQRCRPEFMKNRILVISVPSGAYAQRINEEQTRIVNALADLGDRAPIAVRTIIENGA